MAETCNEWRVPEILSGPIQMIINITKKEYQKDSLGSKSKIYFDNLDSIRFIAALMVYLQHGMSESYQYLHIKGTYWEKFLHVISSGGTGVSIFFVLSGFLITYLLISEYELKSTINIKNFYIRRFLRIWPLYFAVVIFTFVIYPFLKTLIGLNSPLCSNILYHISFLSNFDVIHIMKECPGNDAMSQNITWSVSIEEQFYLFWPLIFTFSPRKFWLFGILLTISASIAFRLINYNDGNLLYYHTLSVLIDLGFGGLFALMIKESNKLKNFFEKSSSKTHIILFAFSFGLLFWSGELFDFKYGAAIGRIFISISFALFICSQALTKTKSFLNLKNLSFASKWGKYTYGIYLLHPISITMLDVLLRILGIPKTNFFITFFIGIVGFIFTLIISKLSYMYFEQKFLTIKDKYAAITTHN